MLALVKNYPLVLPLLTLTVTLRPMGGGINWQFIRIMSSRPFFGTWHCSELPTSCPLVRYLLTLTLSGGATNGQFPSFLGQRGHLMQIQVTSFVAKCICPLTDQLSQT